MQIDYALREMKGLNCYEKLALFIINSRGESYWASQQTMSENMGVGKRTVCRAIKGLEDKGLILRMPDRGPGGSVVYQINYDLIGCEPDVHEALPDRQSVVASQATGQRPTGNRATPHRQTKEELKVEKKEERKVFPGGEQLRFDLCHRLVLRAVDLGVLVEVPDGYQVPGNKKAVASIGQWAEFIEGKPEQERMLRGMIESKESA